MFFLHYLLFDHNGHPFFICVIEKGLKMKHSYKVIGVVPARMASTISITSKSSPLLSMRRLKTKKQAHRGLAFDIGRLTRKSRLERFYTKKTAIQTISGKTAAAEFFMRKGRMC